MSVWAWVKRAVKRPSWQLSLILIGFLIGVTIASFVTAPPPSDLLIVMMLASLLLGAFLLPRPQAFAVLAVCALCFGLWRYSLSFPSEGSDSITSEAGREVRIEGTIVTDPALNGTSQQFALDNLLANGVAKDNKIQVSMQRYPEHSYGDRISFRCKLNLPKSSEDFDYPRYLLRTGIVATCFPRDEALVVSTGNASPIRAVLYDLRHTIQNLLDGAMPEPASSISAGLLLGLKDLPDSLDAAFRKIGVSHIFAASGSNVAMVLLVVSGALAYFTKRQRTLWILLGATFVYVILAGAEAAVVRAGIMGAIVLIASHSGRASSPRNLILLAATLMLIVNPRLLRDDVVFQLSILATTGMMVLRPRFNKVFAFLPETLGIREAMVTTFAATAFTLPIMIFNFHQFPLISPIANLLILPLVPYAMAFAAIAAVVVAIIPPIGVAVGGIAWAIEHSIVIIATALAAL